MDFYLLQRYGLNESGGWFQYVIIVLVIFSLIALSRSANTDAIPLSHWHHRFDSQLFNANEFYEAMATAILSKGMNKLSIKPITYSQGGFLSPNRQYLRIKYEEYVYDFCAAPFGTGYFVSWWLGEKESAQLLFFKNFPIIGKFITKRPKTFYELDTEIMFKETISACVKEVIEQLTQAKGMRALSDTDWHEHNRRFEHVLA